MKAAQVGERVNLKVFGLPTRTKETQYAISSCAKVILAGDMVWKVVVPFVLEKNEDKE